MKPLQPPLAWTAWSFSLWFLCAGPVHAGGQPIAEQPTHAGRLANEATSNTVVPALRRIRVEDDGAKIEELRLGGVTQSIKVKPKNSAPGYEVQPHQDQSVKPAGAATTGDTGPRFWNVLDF